VTLYNNDNNWFTLNLITATLFIKTSESLK